MPSGLMDPLLDDALEDVEELDLKNYSSNGWQNWLTHFNLYVERVAFNSLPDGMKKFALLKKLGDDGMAIFNVLNGPKPITYDQLLALLGDYFIPSNARYIFLTMKQRDDEPFVEFAGRLVTFSYACRFASPQDLIRDVFIANLHDKYASIRDELRRLGDPSLEHVIETAESLKDAAPVVAKPNFYFLNPKLTSRKAESRAVSASGFDDTQSETARLRAKYALPNIYPRDLHEVEVVQVTDKGAFVWLCSHRKKRQEFFKELDSIYNATPTPPVKPKHVGQYVVYEEGRWYRADVINVDYALAEADVLFIDFGFFKKVPLLSFRLMSTKVVEVEPLAVRVTFRDAAQKKSCADSRKHRLMFWEQNEDKSWLVQVLATSSDERTGEAESEGSRADTNGSGVRHGKFDARGGSSRNSQSESGRRLMRTNSSGPTDLRNGGRSTDLDDRSSGASQKGRDANSHQRKGPMDLKSLVEALPDGYESDARSKRSSAEVSRGRSDDDPLGLRPSMQGRNDGYESESKARRSHARTGRDSGSRPSTASRRELNHRRSDGSDNGSAGLRPLMESLLDEPKRSSARPDSQRLNADGDSSEPPVPQLPMGEFTLVTVAQVAGGKTFVVPAIGDMSKRNVFKPTPDKICAALYEGDWYRARVRSFDKDRNEATISYIDFGNTDVVDASKLRTVPYRLTFKSAMQYPVRVEGGRALKPDEKATIKPLSVDDEGVLLVQMKEDEEPRFNRRPVERDDGSCQFPVDEIPKPVPRPKPLPTLNKPTDKGDGSSPFPIDDIAKPVRRRKPPPPIPSRVFTVVAVVYTGDEGTFACKEDDIANITELNEMLAELADLCDPCPRPTVGDLVVAPFQGEYFRARVTEFVDDDRVEVAYVDFGNVATVGVGSLLELPDAVTRDLYTFKIRVDFPVEYLDRFAARPLELGEDGAWSVERRDDD